MSPFGLYQDQLRSLAYVGPAILLGAIIGFEREVEGKPAGLRTHMLVAGAAALFVSVADVIVEQFDVFSAPSAAMWLSRRTVNLLLILMIYCQSSHPRTRVLC